MKITDIDKVKKIADQLSQSVAALELAKKRLYGASLDASVVLRVVKDSNGSTEQLSGCQLTVTEIMSLLEVRISRITSELEGYGVEVSPGDPR